MHGQWLGRFKDGAAEGLIVVDVDDAGTCFEGRAHLFYDDKNYPTAQSYFRTSDRHMELTRFRGLFTAWAGHVSS